MPAIDQRLLLPLASFLSAETRRACFRSLLATLFFVTVLATAMYMVGLPAITVLPWDMAIQWDGAWRIAQGQIPNVDFRAVIPPLTLELSALGLLSKAPSAACIAYGNLILFVVLTGWAWMVASRRLSAASACLFAVFVGITVLAPRPLGDKITAISYAMVYNRQGWAMVAIVVLAAFVPVLPGVTRRPLTGGIVNGVLLG